MITTTKRPIDNRFKLEKVGVTETMNNTMVSTPLSRIRCVTSLKTRNSDNGFSYTVVV